MATNIIECPSCKKENSVDIMYVRTGSKLICKHCNSRIVFKVEGGSSVKDVIDKEIKEAFKKAGFKVR